MAKTPELALRDDISDQAKFAFANISEWKQRIRGLAAKWDRAARVYAMRDTPREDDYTNAGGEEPADGLDAVTIEAGSAQLFGFVDQQAAQVVPPNPAVRLKSRRKKYDKIAEARTLMANDLFEREKFTNKLWKACIRASVFPRAWVYCTWSVKHDRPIFRVLRPHQVWFDQTAEEYDDLRWICRVTVRTRAEIASRTKKKGKRDDKRIYRSDAMGTKNDKSNAVIFGKYPDFLDAPTDKSQRKDREAAKEAYEWAVLYEYYDLVGGKFYVFADEVPKPLYEGPLPNKYLKNPFFLLTFNDNLLDVGGLSDADLVMRIIDNINEMTSIELWSAKTSIPSLLYHEGLVDDGSELQEALEAVDGPGMSVAVKARQNVPLRDILGQTPVTQMPPDMHGSIQRHLDTASMVLAAPGFTRGNTDSGGLATEVSLANAQLKTRNGRRQGRIYECVEWAARASLQLYRELMPEDLEVPIRADDEEEETVLTFKELGFAVPDKHYDFKYAAQPHDALAEDDVATLKKFTDFLPLILQGLDRGELSPRGVFKLVSQVLKAPEILLTAAERAQAQQAATAQSVQGMPGVDNQGIGGAGGEPHQALAGMGLNGTGQVAGLEAAPDAAGLTPAPKPKPPE